MTIASSRHSRAVLGAKLQCFNDSFHARRHRRALDLDKSGDAPDFRPVAHLKRMTAGKTSRPAGERLRWYLVPSCRAKKRLIM
jgi:hypothetical protein